MGEKYGADFMKCSQEVISENDFLPPRSVTYVEIDGGTGERATPDCPHELVVREVFVRGTEPLDYCHDHGGGRYENEESNWNGDRPNSRRRREGSFWDSLFGG